MSLFESIIEKSKAFVELRKTMLTVLENMGPVVSSFDNLQKTVQEFVVSVNQLTQACYSISIEQAAQRKLIEELSDRYLELMRMLNGGQPSEAETKKDTSN